MVFTDAFYMIKCYGGASASKVYFFTKSKNNMITCYITEVQRLIEAFLYNIGIK